MDTNKQPERRGPKPYKDRGRKKIPIRIWRQVREVEARGGRQVVQDQLDMAFEKLPLAKFEPREELKNS